MSNLYLGIDIGGTFIKGVLLDGEKILRKTMLDTNDEFENWQNGVAEVYEELSGQDSGAIRAVGLSAPGLSDPENHQIVCMPGRLQGLEQFDWSGFLGRQVYVLNDAHAALIAESGLGVARGIPNVAMLTLGTGVGGGLLIDGKLVQGFLQRAGHFGHLAIDSSSELRDITGVSGSLEEAMGEASLQRRSLGKFNTTKDLVAAYDSGDHWATYLWLTALRKLALGVVSICNAVSPELVVLAGGITGAGHHLLNPLAAYMDLYEWRPGGQATPVKLAKFKKFSGATGAALFAQSKH